MFVRTTMLIFSQTFNSLCVRDRQKHSLINQHCLDTFLFLSSRRPSLCDFLENSRRLVQPSLLLLSLELVERLGWSSFLSWYLPSILLSLRLVQPACWSLGSGQRVNNRNGNTLTSILGLRQYYCPPLTPPSHHCRFNCLKVRPLHY